MAFIYNAKKCNNAGHNNLENREWKAKKNYFLKTWSTTIAAVIKDVNEVIHEVKKTLSVVSLISI